MSGSDRDYGRELYPFLYEDGGDVLPGELEAVLAEVRASTRMKAREITDLREQILADHAADLAAAARAVAARFAQGGTLFAFGNGGSATDAHDAAADCTTPRLPGWRPLPALSLSSDPAVLTAIVNDVGVGNVFSRQIIAFGRGGDVAVGFSTSGNSANVIAGLEQARRQGMTTVGFAGYDGGRMAAEGLLDHCIVARSDHVPRIQEGHATAWHALLEAVQAVLAREDED